MSHPPTHLTFHSSVEFNIYVIQELVNISDSVYVYIVVYMYTN